MKKWIVLVVVMLLAAWTIMGCGATPEAEEAAPAQEQAAPAQEETASEEQVQEEVEEQSETSAAAETASGDLPDCAAPTLTRYRWPKEHKPRSIPSTSMARRSPSPICRWVPNSTSTWR